MPQNTEFRLSCPGSNLSFNKGSFISLNKESSISSPIVLYSTFYLVNPDYTCKQAYDYYYPYADKILNTSWPAKRPMFKGKDVNLPLASKYYNLTINIHLTSCSKYQEFAYFVDHALINQPLHLASHLDLNRFILPYLDEFKTFYPSFNYDDNLYQPFKIRQLLEYFTLPYVSSDTPNSLCCIKIEHYNRAKFKLYCCELLKPKFTRRRRRRYVKRVLEETSLLEPGSTWEGIKHSFYALYNFSTRTSEKFDEFKATVETWMLEIGDLMANFSVKKIIFSILKLLNNFLHISDCLSFITTQMYKTYNYLLSTQSTQDNSVILEPTSLLDDIPGLDSYTPNAPAIAAAFAVAVTVVANALCMKDLINNKTNDNLTTRIANAFVLNSRAQSSVTTIIKNIMDFSKATYEATFELILGEKSSDIYKLIHQTSVIENENCKKRCIFDYLEFLEHPANLHSIHLNQVYKSQLEFCHSIFTEVNLILTTQDHKNIPNHVREYVKQRITSLNSIRSHIFKRPTVDSVRFTPFWVNILGKPGLGKSVMVPLLSNYLHETLSKIPEDFEITSKDRWVFPVNFSDEYLTHYNGHYIVTCDDFLQDTPGTLDQSSALKMITWVSCIPNYTVQAALSDKGTPFTSKIIITTSNDKNMDRTSEIASKEALERRMAICVELFEDTSSDPKDFAIGPPSKKIKIRRLDPMNRNNVVKIYKNFKEFLSEFVSEYVLWYREQQVIIKSRTPQLDFVNEVLESVSNRCSINQESVVNSVVSQVTSRIYSLEETSSYYCKLGFAPKLKEFKYNDINTISFNETIVKLHDCTCDVHRERNGRFKEYLHVTEGRNCYTNIHQFESYLPPSLTAIFKSKCIDLLNSVGKMLKSIWENKTARLVLFGFMTLTLAYSTHSNITKVLSSNIEGKESIAASIGISSATSQLRLGTHLIPTAAQYSMNVTRPKGFKGIIRPTKLEMTNAELEPILSQTISKQTYDLAYLNLIKNGAIVQLYHQTKELNQRINTGLRIAGRAILSNHHFFSHLKDGDKFVVKYFHQTTGSQQVEQIFDSSNMHRLDNLDLCVYNCSSVLPQCKNIIKHFSQDNEVKLMKQDSMVVTRHPANSTPIVLMNVITKPVTFNHTYGAESYSVLDSYETNCPVEKGMSGSVLLSTDTRLPQKILGVQTCRDQNTLCGYFQPITAQMLQEACKLLNVFEFETVGSALEECCVVVDTKCPPNIVSDQSLSYIGTVPKTKVIRAQLQTKLLPSEIHNPNERTQEPSVLNDYDERMDPELQGKSVIFRAIEGFNTAKGVVDTRLLKEVVQDLKVEYDVTLDIESVSRRLLNDNEMINGIPQMYNRIEMKSSPGYPLVLERKDTNRAGKYEWFEEITPPMEGYGKTYVMTKELAAGMEQHEQLMLSGKKPPVVAYACLKDETRALAKIKTGSTRAFVCLPLIFNLLIRKYFGAFIICQHQKAGVITSCVGVDPAKQWKNLYSKLMRVSDYWEDFDYKNWDQHLPPDFVLAVAEIVNNWYGDDMSSPAGKLRYMLLYDLVFTNIIVKNRLFQKSTGQCSGCAITAELNCIVHDILMYYVWLKVNRKEGIQTNLSQYREVVASIMYGDDIVMSVHNDFKSLFNGNTIYPHMVELGMKITPGDKVSSEFVPKLAKDILFLKRSFIKDGDYVKAPLRSDIVENIPQWIHKCDNPLEATKVNMETALRESYMHGEKYFSEMLRKLNNRVKLYNRDHRDHPLPPVCMSYQSIDLAYRNSDYVCAGLAAAPAEFDEW